MRTICIFCGAQSGFDARHSQVAADLGERLARADMRVVYGGSALGCMGALADGATRAGGSVIGVAPAFLLDGETRHPALARFEQVADLATRKLRMLELSDAVVVLPGGTGTLDELLEAMTMKRLGLIRHPIVVINTDHFFGPLLEQLQQMVRHGFADNAQMQLLNLVNEPATAVRVLATHTPPAR